MRESTAHAREHGETPLVVGAYSLLSAEFVVPLRTTNSQLRVLVLPPHEYGGSRSYEGEARDSIARGYLCARLPLSLERRTLFGRTNDEAVRAATRWVRDSADRLIQQGLHEAARRWRANGDALLAGYESQLREAAPPLRPAVIAVQFLRALYRVAGRDVDVQTHDGILRLPLRRSESPEDYEFFRTLLTLSERDGLRGMSGRAKLVCQTSTDHRWWRVTKLKPRAPGEVSIEIRSRPARRVRVRVSADAIELIDERPESSVLLRPLGALRLVQLAEYGVPAHVPWYVATGKAMRAPVWSIPARCVVLAHAPLSHRTLRATQHGAGAYLWEGGDAAQSNGYWQELTASQVGAVQGTELGELTSIAQMMRGPRCRASPLTHARGALQNEWRRFAAWAVLAPPPAGAELWKLLDCLRLAVRVWVCLREMRRAAFLSGQLDTTPLRRVLSGDPAATVGAFETGARGCGLALSTRPRLFAAAFRAVRDPASMDIADVRRSTRGWLECSAGLLALFWEQCGQTLAADLPSVVLLGQWPAVAAASTALPECRTTIELFKR